MWFTMFLLCLVYGAFVYIMVQISPIYISIAVVMVLFQFALSDRMVLASMRAKVVTPQEAPELHAIVDRLSQAAGIPKPKVAISDMNVANAFATGRSQKHAAVAVTTGLMNMLNRDELEGVLAHEISHIRSKDVVVMTYASFFVIVAGTLSTFLMFSAIFGGMGRNRGGGGHSYIMIALIVTLLVRFLGGMLVAALSRYREFSADRGAALLTRQPRHLASALQRISGSFTRLPRRRPAARREHERILYHARGRRRARQPLLDPPTLGQTHRAAQGARARYRVHVGHYHVLLPV